MYFFKARRRFCLRRLYEFFRASCFMLILLVRRDKPAGYAGWEFRTANHPGNDWVRRFPVLRPGLRIVTLSLHL
jgi:hypothetical protein